MFFYRILFVILVFGIGYAIGMNRSGQFDLPSFKWLKPGESAGANTTEGADRRDPAARRPAKEVKAKPGNRSSGPRQVVFGSRARPREKTKVVLYNEAGAEKGSTIYAVQIASFQEFDKAQSLVGSLQKKQINAYVAPVTSQGWYRVCVGESISLHEARQKMLSLKGTFKDSFIIGF